MPHPPRSELDPPPAQPFVAEPSPVVVVDLASPGGVNGRLLRHAPRCSEIAATQRAALARYVWGGALIALGAITLALLVLPRDMCGHGSRHDAAGLARLKLKQYAFEAYPSWLVDHPDRVCPGSLHELAAYMNTDDPDDPWGTPIELRCDPSQASDRKGLRLRSAGQDRRFDTADDLASSD
jgi:hypothetical protein